MKKQFIKKMDLKFNHLKISNCNYFIMRIILVSTCIILNFSNYSFAEINKEFIPELYSPSNAGTEFEIGFIPVLFDPYDGFNTIQFFFSSSVTTTIRAKVPHSLFDSTIVVPPNEVTRLIIPASYILQYSRPEDTVKMRHKVYERNAVYITSDSPVICYALLRLKNQTEGFVAIPKNFWGRDYNLSTYSDHKDNVDFFSPSTAVVVGGYDNTRVTFKLGGNETTRVRLPNGDSVMTGGTFQQTLNKGDVWVIPAFGVKNNLSGSTIRANKPVAVYSGNYCSNVPNNLGPCGYLIEQEIPVYNYAHRYFVTPIHNREKGSFVTVSAQFVNTVVKLNGEIKGTIADFSGVEGVGYLNFRVNENNSPAIISSDSRINVVQYNYGTASFFDRGIPFKMQVLSEDDFSKNFKFHLPAISTSQYFTSTFMNIIYKPDAGGNIPEDLYLIEMKGSQKTIKTVKELAKEDPIPFPEIEEDGRRYYSLTIELPQSGNYVVKSPEPVGVVIYGSNANHSFGFPGHIQLKNFEKINDNRPPNFSITEFHNGTITGEIFDEPLNQSNVRSNLAMIHLITDSSYNYNLLIDNFVPSIDNLCTFDLRPLDVGKPAQAYLRAVDFAGNDTIIKFNYSNEPVLPKIIINDFTYSEFCPETDYSIDFDVTAAQFQFSNTFRLKLSRINPDKPFFPLTLAEANGNTARSFDFSIPITLSRGSDYFLYIEATNPSVKSDTIFDLQYFSMPDLKITGYDKVFSGNTYHYSTQSGTIAIKWTITGGELIGNDNDMNIQVKWGNDRSGNMKLAYTSDDGCTVIREIQVQITPDNNNKIEGPDNSCLNDVIAYNSFINEGKFQWAVTGGEFVGSREEPLIRIKWLNVGEGKINLIHTDMNGYVKEIEMTVNVANNPDKPTISALGSVLTSSSTTGNQWYFNKEIIPGARARTYDAGENDGIYNVVVTVSGCASDMSDDFVYKPTSVYDLMNQSEINIYPNPANSNLINVDLNLLNSEIKRLQVFDLNGKLLKTIHSSLLDNENFNFEIDISNLPNGQYNLSVETTNGRITQKIVIAR